MEGIAGERKGRCKVPNFHLRIDVTLMGRQKVRRDHAPSPRLRTRDMFRREELCSGCLPIKNGLDLDHLDN